MMSVPQMGGLENYFILLNEKLRLCLTQCLKIKKKKSDNIIWSLKTSIGLMY